MKSIRYPRPHHKIGPAIGGLALECVGLGGMESGFVPDC